MRKIISKVAREELSPAQRKNLRVEIGYNRPGENRSGEARFYVSGWAYIGGTLMKLKVNKDGIDRLSFARTTAHEMAHIRGLNHDRIHGKAIYDWRVPGSDELYKWALSFPLDSREKKQTVQADMRAKRYDAIMSRIAGWQVKAKRAANALKKLAKQRRYYERVLANKAPEEK